MSDNVCPIKMWDNSSCGRQTYEGKKKCIFHLENKSDNEAKIFEIAFCKELDRIENDKNIRQLDFTGFIFPNVINLHHHIFEKQVIFQHTLFNDKAVFSGAQFYNTAIFSGAKFNKEASFAGTQFEEAYFTGTQFKRVHFNGAQFSYATFDIADFWGESHFIDTKFLRFFRWDKIPGNDNARLTNFLTLKFGVDLIETAKIEKIDDDMTIKVSNEKNYFSLKLNDEKTEVNLKIDDGRTDKFIAKMENGNLNVYFSSNEDFLFFEKVISFEEVKFHKPKYVRFHNVDLSNVSFLNTDVSEVEFLDVKWTRKDGRLAVIDESQIGKNYYSPTYGAVTQLYRRLRKNYETNYKFAEAGEFFVGEMEMRRLNVNTNIKNKKIRNIVLRLIRIVSPLGFYKLLSLYGESYFRPIIWSSIVVVSYPLLMHLLFDASLPQSNDFLYTHLGNSVFSFLQIDNTYKGERIIGFLLLGLLFIALKRKYERKK